MTATNSSTNTVSKSDFYKWEVLILLWFAYWFNQADRQIYNTLIEKIKISLEMTDAQAGLVATVFMWVLAFCFPLAGFAVDRFSKKAVIVASLMLWSAATVVSGGCGVFLMFILFRSLATGVGEGCFAPASYSMLGEYHDKDTRATAMSIYTTAQYLGIVVCGLLAGYIADTWDSLRADGGAGLGALSFMAGLDGWRLVFFTFGTLGVLLSVLIIWRLKDKITANASQSSQPKLSIWESVKVFFSIPSAVLLTVCFSGVVFVVQAYLTWSTAYLQEFKMSNTEAGFNSVLWAHVGSFVGILIAGRLSDCLAAKKPQYRVLMQSLGYLLAAPFIVVAGLSHTIWVIYFALVAFGFFRGFYDTNIYVTLYDVVPSKYKGSATGIMLFLGFMLASPGPWILGLLRPHIGLSWGIASLSLVFVALGLLLLVIYKFFYAKDVERANAANAQ